jgi:hypothetical protein
MDRNRKIKRIRERNIRDEIGEEEKKIKCVKILRRWKKRKDKRRRNT